MPTRFDCRSRLPRQEPYPGGGNGSRNPGPANGSAQTGSFRTLRTLSEQLKFPIVAKPYNKNCVSDFKVRHFQSPQALQEAFGDHCEPGQILLQEFAPGEGVGIETLMHHGEPIAIFQQHRRLKEVPSTGGAAAVAVSETPAICLVTGDCTTARTTREGVAMVEFRQDRAQGRSALMEVNGRYWGTIELPIDLGVEFPWYEWQIAHDQRPTPPNSVILWEHAGDGRQATFGVGMTCFPPWPSERSNIPDFCETCYPRFAYFSPMSHDALWQVFDPLPAISELFHKAEGNLVEIAALAHRYKGFLPPARKRFRSEDTR